MVETQIPTSDGKKMERVSGDVLEYQPIAESYPQDMKYILWVLAGFAGLTFLLMMWFLIRSFMTLDAPSVPQTPAATPATSQ